MHSLPELLYCCLVIQLKRFKVVTKICNEVSFTRKIELEEVHNKNEKYIVEASLYSVIVHTGSSKVTGHYYAYVKGSDGKWRKFDDSSVYEVSWAEVERSQAYMLFYKKISVTRKKASVKSEQGVLSRNTVTSQVKRGVIDDYGHPLQLKKKKPNETANTTAPASSTPKVIVNGDAKAINGVAEKKAASNGVATCENKTLPKKVEADTDVSSPGLKLVMAYE